jgi:hypothetical protein
MSHFTTIVIVPSKDEKDLKKVEKLLRPYDENKTVPGYLRDCHCTGSQADKEVEIIVEDKLGKIDTVRKDFAIKYPNLPYKEQEKIWKEQVQIPRETLRKELMGKHPLAKTPDPDCTQCKGTGKYKSTYNPKSKWDWYVVGGRWDNYFGCNHPPVERLIELAKSKEPKTPYSIVTPDGEWHQEGDMGYWGMTFNEIEEDVWNKEILEIYEKYKDHIGVVCDLHI